jgi:hypothetical protein
MRDLAPKICGSTLFADTTPLCIYLLIESNDDIHHLSLPWIIKSKMGNGTFSTEEG